MSSQNTQPQMLPMIPLPSQVPMSIATIIAPAIIIIYLKWSRNKVVKLGKDSYIPAKPRSFLGGLSTLQISRSGTWSNWSQELSSNPQRLYSNVSGATHPAPRSIADLQAIVREAHALGVTVRAFGSSHSYTKLVPNDDGFLVDNRMIGALPSGRYDLAVEKKYKDGKKKGWARIRCPPGIISKEFEKWLWDVAECSLPASAFEATFSMGGMAATATHGAGLQLGTVSDYVVGVVFVDGKGDVREWRRDDPCSPCTDDELAAAQCSLGSLGLVYSLIFELPPRYEVISYNMTVNAEDYFGNTDAALTNLRNLHRKYDTVQFIWSPVSWTGNISKTMSVLATQRYDPSNCEHTAISARRSALAIWALFNLWDLPFFLLGGVMVKIAEWFPNTLCAPIRRIMAQTKHLWTIARDDTKYRVPQYVAHHPVNSVFLKTLNSTALEWSVPFRPDAIADAPDGFRRMQTCFMALVNRSTEAYNTYNRWTDTRSLPVSWCVEMRSNRASGALLSPSYQPHATRGEFFYCTPQIATTVTPSWREYGVSCNELFTTTFPGTRAHLAKESFDYPHPDFPSDDRNKKGGGMMEYTREQYRRAGTWERFLAVRKSVDPDGVFLNKHLKVFYEVD